MASKRFQKVTVFKLFKTSLKIFKHYKLKPRFPIIKDNKTKDTGGVGNKPPLPHFGRSINPNFNPIWLKLISFNPH